MPLRTLAPGLFVVDHPLVAGGLHLGTRTTLLEVAPGELVLHAPGPLAEADIEAIRAEGAVVGIVAPNQLHHLFLGRAREAFPEATVYAPPSLAAKAAAANDSVPIASAPFGDVLDAVAIGGAPKLAESVLFHRPTRTLVVADLVFNLRPPKPWLTRAVMAMNGGFDRFGPTRVFRSMVKDRPALRGSLDAVFAWDFDRVIMAHGDVLPSGGKAAMIEAFAKVA